MSAPKLGRDTVTPRPDPKSQIGQVRPRNEPRGGGDRLSLRFRNSMSELAERSKRLKSAPFPVYIHIFYRPTTCSLIAIHLCARVLLVSMCSGGLPGMLKFRLSFDSRLIIYSRLRVNAQRPAGQHTANMVFNSHSALI